MEEEDFENEEAEKDKEFIYEQKVLFGSTEIEFYEILMRKILEMVFE